MEVLRATPGATVEDLFSRLPDGQVRLHGLGGAVKPSALEATLFPGEQLKVELAAPGGGVRLEPVHPTMAAQLVEHAREANPYSGDVDWLLSGQRLEGADAGLRLSEAQLEALRRQLPIDKPIRLNGVTVTFGFEAEFRGPNAKRVIRHGNVNQERFPWLDSNWDKEDSGNFEVRSRPAKTLGKTLRQMETLKAELGSSLKSFHLTAYVPKEAVARVGEGPMRGWMSRTADSIQAWRLARAPFWALGTETVGRITPNALRSGEVRGTLRSYPITHDRHRIELRGYMGAVTQYGQLMQDILIGLKHPKYVRGFVAEQNATFKGHPLATLEGLMASLKGESLSTQDEKALRLFRQALSPKNSWLKKSPGNRNLLPLLGYEAAPHVTSEQRARFPAATERFLQDTYALMQQPLPKGKQQRTERRDAFRELVHTWAEEAHLEEVLGGSVLLQPGAKALQTPQQVQRLLGLSPTDTVSALKAQPDLVLQEGLERLPPEGYGRFVRRLPARAEAKRLWRLVDATMSPPRFAALARDSRTAADILAQAPSKGVACDWLRAVPAEWRRELFTQLSTSDLNALKAEAWPRRGDELSGDLSTLSDVQAQLFARGRGADEVVRLLSGTDAYALHLRHALLALPLETLRPVLKRLDTHGLEALLAVCPPKPFAQLVGALTSQDARLSEVIVRTLTPQGMRALATARDPSQLFARVLRAAPPARTRALLAGIPSGLLDRPLRSVKDDALKALRKALPATPPPGDALAGATAAVDLALLRRGLEVGRLEDALAQGGAYAQTLLQRAHGLSGKDLRTFLSALTKDDLRTYLPGLPAKTLPRLVMGLTGKKHARVRAALRESLTPNQLQALARTGDERTSRFVAGALIGASDKNLPGLLRKLRAFDGDDLVEQLKLKDLKKLQSRLKSVRDDLPRQGRKLLRSVKDELQERDYQQATRWSWPYRSTW